MLDNETVYLSNSTELIVNVKYACVIGLICHVGLTLDNVFLFVLFRVPFQEF